METQERTEREIDLIELFWEVLLGWRQIICIGILFAVLLTGMRYLLDVRSFHASQNVDIEKEKEKLKQDDLEALNRAVNTQVRLDEFEAYRENSPLLQLDPYAKPVLEMQYYVKSDYIINYTKDSKRDYTQSLSSMYYNYINGGEMAKKVVEDAGLSVSQSEFRELLSVSREENTIVISVGYADAGKLETIAQTLKSALQQKKEELQEIGPHDLELMNESQNVVVDSALVEKKNTVFNSINSLTNIINNLKKDMSAQQLRLFQMEMNDRRGESEEIKEPKIRIKYMILGAFVGAFLTCAWIAGSMIFNRKLQSAEEIYSMYKVRLIGEITLSNQKKRFLSVIDKLILSLKNRGKRKLTADQQIKMIATNTALSCRSQGIDSIYLTGSAYEKADKGLLEQLKTELLAQNIKVKIGASILYDADSLKEGIETGHILFVEQKGISRHEEIFQEFNLVKEQKSDILGVVVFV
ncbi:MAG: hypothetical protein HFI74_00425 [Lachnospiraceae bacterium]|jgi:capsular polysaccharide biosynthesis protein|nr:hypothetical protein [Lachnospiraceae bacterium]